MARRSFWWWKYDDPRITDDDLNEIAERYDPSDPAPWHPVDPGVDRYFGMVFYWFDRADFDIRIPLSVVNTQFDRNDSLASRQFYIRWGNMNYKGAFCIVVQEPRSAAKAMPKADYPNTWRFRVPAYKGFAWARFPNYSKMRWGYVNIAPQQMFLHWWTTGWGQEGWDKIYRGFTDTRTYYLKEWPFKDPMYPLYQRVVRELVKKDWTPRGSYFDLRKM